MALTDQTFNNFTRSLSNFIAQRAVGLDDSSKRIVGIRPPELVLAGFLTPTQIPREQPMRQPDEDEIDEFFAEDLPQDSPYEQTAMGFEWLAPREALHHQATMKVTINCAMFVRRFPTFEEQRGYGTTKSRQQKTASPERHSRDQEQLSPIYYQDPVMVWTREQFSQPLTQTIDLGELLQKRILREDLGDSLRMSLVLGSDLFPQRNISIPMAALRDEPAYQEWQKRQPRLTLTTQFWQPTIDVRISAVPTEPDCVRIALRLINRTLPHARQDQEDFFDPNLYAVAIQADIPQTAHKSMVFQELPQSYRYNRLMQGIGINSHMEYEEQGDRIILTSEAVPRMTVPRLDPRLLPGPPPRFESLAQNPMPILNNILTKMRSYYENDWAAKRQSLNGRELNEATSDREAFLLEIQRFERGIQLLANKKYPKVAHAFRLMNEVMDQLGKQTNSSYDTWRLFQIVFIVSMLPALASREYQELFQQEQNFYEQVDLLWFAAGGGKTEAFLGIILWQAFFDRLRGKTIGVTAFVRFPLRLLTFQQLQRLGNALGQAELIRIREKLGGQRFSLGFFVGGTVTDNRINEDTHQRYCKLGLHESQKRIFQCIFCASPTTLKYNQARRLIEHWCTRADSDCPGGNQRIPVYVVDDDLYCYLPTVIVSTVDKMAGFGQNQRFANLLGRFDMVCPIHGASFLDTNNHRCAASKERKNGARPTFCMKDTFPISYGPFHDPGPALLVQDELHLLSEELGTFDSHYETAIAEMSRSLGYKPWKIIAATATIQQYQDHSWQLYLKQACQFPAPGPGAYESFYYTVNKERTGRIFMGLVGVGRKHTPAVTRALTLTYLSLDAARKLSEQDPLLASQVYQIDPLTPDEWKFLLFLYELPLIYTLTRKGSDMVAEAIESQVKKELYSLAAEYGDLLIDMFNSGVEISTMMERMQEIRQATPDTDPSSRTRGLVTTNIIGHGVDIDRFNIMIFAGFPRLVSEYIQASARVGRTFPGISIFVATPQSERDRGVFNRFNKFHEYLDRLVDPSAIARWPLPALVRTVPGILAGYIMGFAANEIEAKLGTVEQVQDHYGDPNATVLNIDPVVEWMQRAYGADYANSQERYKQKLTMTVQNNYSTVLRKQRSAGRYTALNSHLGAMRSLRDIDDPGSICIDNPTDIAIVRRLIRGEE